MTILISEFTYLYNVSIKRELYLKNGKLQQQYLYLKLKTLVSDLRPISLLSLPGKILETFIHRNYREYLEFFKILSDRQFGFCPALSTIDTIFTLINDKGSNLNNGKLTLTTFIDFGKAFDTLDHLILMHLRTLQCSISTI